MNGFIWYGQVVRVPFPFAIIDGRVTGQWFEPDNISARQRPATQVLDQLLFHHTGGERGAKGICQTLRARELSVHFTIDNHGIITQHADLGTICYHAGKRANPRSAGCEMSNRGLAPPLPGKPRAPYRAKMHGRVVNFLKFHPCQLRAAWTLTKGLIAVSDIPLKVETRRRYLWRKPAGIIGHYNVSKKKVDPSPHLMAHLEAMAL